MASFGEGLGGAIGGVLADQQLQDTQSKVTDVANRATTGVSDIAGNFGATNTVPYNTFGQSFLPAATSAIGNIGITAKNTQGYNDFMSSYTNTPAAQYQLQQANEAQNNSAAARGGLLSGSNLRQLGTIDSGIVAQNANTAYNEYLSGNNQQFGQLESALGNMFQAIGVGQTATGQQASVTNAQIGGTASIANAQNAATSSLGQASARNDQGKGSGVGSMLGSLGSAAFMF